MAASATIDNLGYCCWWQGRRLRNLQSEVPIGGRAEFGAVLPYLRNWPTEWSSEERATCVRSSPTSEQRRAVYRVASGFLFKLG